MPQQESTKSEEILSSPEQESRPIDKLAAEGNAIYRRFKDADMSTVAGVLTLGGLGIAAGAGALTTAPVWVPLAVGGLGVAALASDYIGDNDEVYKVYTGLFIGDNPMIAFEERFREDGSRIDGSGAGSGLGAGSGMGSGSGSGSGMGGTDRLSNSLRFPRLQAVRPDSYDLPGYNPEAPGGGLKSFDIRKLNLFKLAKISARNSYALNFNLAILRVSFAKRESKYAFFGTNNTSASGFIQYQGQSAAPEWVPRAAKQYEMLLLPEYREDYEREKKIYARNETLMTDLQRNYARGSKYINTKIVTEPDPENPGKRKIKDEYNWFPFFILDTSFKNRSEFNNTKYFDSRFAPDEMAFIDIFGGFAIHSLKYVRNSYTAEVLQSDGSYVKKNLIEGITFKEESTKNLNGDVEGKINGTFPYWLCYINHFSGSGDFFMAADAAIRSAGPEAGKKYQWTSPSLGIKLSDTDWEKNPNRRKDANLESGLQRAAGIIRGHSFMYAQGKPDSFFTQSQVDNKEHHKHPSWAKNHILSKMDDGSYFFGSLWSDFLSKCGNDTNEAYGEVINRSALPSHLIKIDLPGQDPVYLPKDFSKKINEYYLEKDLVIEKIANMPANNLNIYDIIDRKIEPRSNTAYSPSYIESGREVIGHDTDRRFTEYFFLFNAIYTANLGYGLILENALSPNAPPAGPNFSQNTINSSQTLERRMSTLEDSLRKEHLILVPGQALISETPSTSAPATPTASPTAKAGSAPAEFPAKGGSGEQ